VLYETEAGAFSDSGLASWSRHVETGIQTDELDRPAEVYYNDGGDRVSEFIGHYVLLEDEIARFVDAHFGTMASPYL
jgi:hypothetical protein